MCLAELLLPDTADPIEFCLGELYISPFVYILIKVLIQLVQLIRGDLWKGSLRDSEHRQ